MEDNMYCVMIEIDLNSGERSLSHVNHQDIKSLVLRSVSNNIPEASISFVGSGHADSGSKWVILAHVVDLPTSKVITALKKSVKGYSDAYGNFNFAVSYMAEQ
jgi:hypothetical protein